jgi:formamidopyrimidine-DNA glycosylase
MPELPEVETVRRTLLPAIGATITGVATSGKPLRLGARVPVAALRRLIGARLTAMRRVGKYLLVDTDRAAAILVHLGMSGRFRVASASDPPAPHTHVTLALDGGRALRFSDPRRFGSVDVVTPAGEAQPPGVARAGSRSDRQRRRRGAPARARARQAHAAQAVRSRPGVVAGVGNIYASEALWQCRLAPTRPAGHAHGGRGRRPGGVDRRGARRTRSTHGGTSLRDFVDADGAEGENADYLVVYGRDGTPCPRCQRTIRRTVLGGRATYECTRCQR